jgi:hypothetical protein
MRKEGRRTAGGCDIRQTEHISGLNAQAYKKGHQDKDTRSTVAVQRKQRKNKGNISAIR